MSYSNILVAIDLSEESRAVLEVADSIASKSAAKLHLITVLKPLSQVYGGLDMAPISTGAVSFEEEALTQAREQLKTLAQEHHIAAPDVHVLMGSPAHEIRELALSKAADLIVMGSHGRHGISRLMGSTANATLHDAPCNVLAVRLYFDS